MLKFQLFVCVSFIILRTNYALKLFTKYPFFVENFARISSNQQLFTDFNDFRDEVQFLDNELQDLINDFDLHESTRILETYWLGKKFLEDVDYVSDVYKQFLQLLQVDNFNQTLLIAFSESTLKGSSKPVSYVLRKLHDFIIDENLFSFILKVIFHIGTLCFSKNQLKPILYV